MERDYLWTGSTPLTLISLPASGGSTTLEQVLIALFALVRHPELDWSTANAIDECTRVDGLKKHSTS
jgi:hypothetical protein